MPHFLVATAPLSGNWLPISSCGLRLDNETVRVAVGITREPHTCRCSAMVDARGLHSFMCKHAPGRTTRHYALNDVIFRAFSSAGIPATNEPVGLTHLDGKKAWRSHISALVHRQFPDMRCNGGEHFRGLLCGIGGVGGWGFSWAGSSKASVTIAIRARFALDSTSIRESCNNCDSIRFALDSSWIRAGFEHSKKEWTCSIFPILESNRIESSVTITIRARFDSRTLSQLRFDSNSIQAFENFPFSNRVAIVTGSSNRIELESSSNRNCDIRSRYKKIFRAVTIVFFPPHCCWKYRRS